MHNYYNVGVVVHSEPHPPSNSYYNVRPSIETNQISEDDFTGRLEYVDVDCIESVPMSNVDSTISYRTPNNDHNEISSPEKEETVLKGNRTENKMFYEIEDIPPWYLTIFLGFQHCILMIGTSLSYPLILMPLMCMRNFDQDQGNVVSTILFVSGISTILQSSFGTRLPIIQGPSFIFVVPAITLLQSDKWKCPAHNIITNWTADQATKEWQSRMREIQGALIIASLVQIAMGFFGVFGFITHHITPITKATAFFLLGISIFKHAANLAAINWLISLLTIVISIVFSQYLKHYKIPIPFTQSKKRPGRLRYPMFQIFPVLLSIIIVWTLYEILVATERISASSDRTNDILGTSPWFKVPWPFQWGAPTFTGSAIIGFMAPLFAGIVESLCDYQAAAKVVHAPPPTIPCVNRGVFMEGLGLLIGGVFGTGNGITSYSENTGAISITRVGSRRVVQTAGFILMVASLCGKFGGIFVVIPDAIIGGILCITFSVIVGTGFSNLQNVRLSSSRNLFIFGFSVFFPTVISNWVAATPNCINFKNDSLNEAIEIFLTSGMFVGALISFILDNTIPRSEEDEVKRPNSLDNANQAGDNNESESSRNYDYSVYDLPFGMTLLRKHKLFTWFPISPTFQKSNFTKLLKRELKT